MVNNQSENSHGSLTLQFLSCVPIRLFDWNSLNFVDVSCSKNVIKCWNIKKKHY